MLGVLQQVTEDPVNTPPAMFPMPGLPDHGNRAPTEKSAMGGMGAWVNGLPGK